MTRRIGRTQEDNGRIRWLSEEEQSKLRNAIAARTPQHVPAFDLSVHTGMRTSEQFSLGWPQIDSVPLRPYSAPNQEREAPPHSFERCRCGGTANPKGTARLKKTGFPLGVPK
jgi:hypothetical protein